MTKKEQFKKKRKENFYQVNIKYRFDLNRSYH